MGMRDAGKVTGRRGLLAGAAALVAGGLAKLTGAGRAEAAHDGSSDQEVIHAGQTNTTSALTIINRVFGNGPAILGLTAATSEAAVQGGGLGDDGEGVFGIGGRYGVRGQSAGDNLGDSGVKGVALGSGPATNGVWGENVSPNVSARGVLGEATASTTNATFGVSGNSNSTSTGAIGTFGRSINGSGVRGESTSGNGMLGVSTNASGVYGFSNLSFGAAGVSNTGVGVYASSGSNWGLHAASPIFAGVFSGAVYVNGNFTVANGAKSAAVRNRRGEHRRMYCQESPEAWFEDFGEATLANGRAVVPLDPEFDEVVKGDNYHVFLTEYGDLGGLYVADRRPHRFEVRSRSGAAGPFAYRVVARRLDDIGRRLEKVDVPDFSKVKAPATPPELPPGHDGKGRPDGRDARPRDDRGGGRD